MTMQYERAVVLSLLLVAGLLAPVWAQPAVSITVGPEPQVYPIVLNPGFITTVRFDRPVQYVAVGNPEVLSVRLGGWMNRDVLLEARAPGETNMQVWAGEAIVLFRVIVSVSVPRTPELVLVRVVGRLSPPERLPSAEARGGEKVLVAEMNREGIVATFSLERRRSGISVRYRLVNLSGKVWKAAPQMAVVWADGKVVPFALFREIRGVEPALLLPGSSEAGVFTVMRDARALRLLLPLYPDDGKGGPVWFEPVFSGVDRMQFTDERR